MLIVKQASQDVGDKVQELEAQGRKAVRKASPWIVRLGRIGLVAKGVVYLILGWLAIQTAFYHQGELTDQRGASERAPPTLRRRAARPDVLRLFAYMVWRMCRRRSTRSGSQTASAGWSKRIFRFGSGIIYGGLGVAAARLLVGMQANRRSPSDWTAMVMRRPLGKWLVAAAGLGIVGYGMFRIYKAWEGELKKHLVLDAYAARARGWITGIGRLGQAGAASCSSSWAPSPSSPACTPTPTKPRASPKPSGSSNVPPYGPYLLGAVAAGLIAYGLFQFVEARYRRISAA